MELPEEAMELLTGGNIIAPEAAIAERVEQILGKLWKGEPLSRGDLAQEVTPAEVAAIWSIKHRIPFKTDYVRQVRRHGRIEPSKEWGKGPTYRCLYKVREVLHVEVGHQRGRPAKNTKMAA
jgi:hypothetical protein